MAKIAGILVAAGFLLNGSIVSGQGARLQERNSLSWFTINADKEINQQWGIHLDANHRRSGFLDEYYQNLVRVGVNYKPGHNILLRAGYVFAETEPFGEAQEPISHQASKENRIYEMALFTLSQKHLDISHRIILEQRWNGKFSTPYLSQQDQVKFSNRARYRFRVDLPLKRRSRQGFPYLVLSEEVMINFGKNITNNMFDQNRIVALGGYQVTKQVKIESGYMHQLFQLSRQYDGRNLFQNNHTWTTNVLLNLP